MDSVGSGMDDSDGEPYDAAPPMKRSRAGEATLFMHIKSGMNIPEVAAGWVARYQDERDSALMEIIQLFVTCTGSVGTVTPELYQGIGDGFLTLLQGMGDELPTKCSIEYPLITNVGKRQE